jgi:post-segregation antitoxin (ccd killing protein)
MINTRVAINDVYCLACIIASCNSTRANNFDMQEHTRPAVRQVSVQISSRGHSTARHNLERLSKFFQVKIQLSIMQKRPVDWQEENACPFTLMAIIGIG